MADHPLPVTSLYLLLHRQRTKRQDDSEDWSDWWSCGWLGLVATWAAAMDSAYASEIWDHPSEALNSRPRGVGRHRPGAKQFEMDHAEQDLGRARGR